MKWADVKAVVDYIQGVSIGIKSRIGVFTVPPRGDNDRYTHVSIGFGSESIEVAGYGDDLSCSWYENGERQFGKLSELARCTGDCEKCIEEEVRKHDRA